MAALNRFISKLGEQGLPFFKLLKNQEKFRWTAEADPALAQLKDFLSKPPVLMAPRKKEQLLLYLAATTHVVSTAIVVKQQEEGQAYPVQRPVYFVSEVLLESKARYEPIQKLLYAVLITSRKLRHYFQEYLMLPSLTTHSVTYSTIRTLLEESPSGQSNSAPSRSTSRHILLSSSKH
jgi:dsDNA-binding SOS-regulon protein